MPLEEVAKIFGDADEIRSHYPAEALEKQDDASQDLEMGGVATLTAQQKADKSPVTAMAHVEDVK